MRQPVDRRTRKFRNITVERTYTYINGITVDKIGYKRFILNVPGSKSMYYSGIHSQEAFSVAKVLTQGA